MFLQFVPCGPLIIQNIFIQIDFYIIIELVSENSFKYPRFSAHTIGTLLKMFWIFDAVETPGCVSKNDNFTFISLTNVATNTILY